MAATPGPRPGIEGAAYRNTGTDGSPTWAEIGLIRDVAPALPWDLVEAGSRETLAKLYAKTRWDIGYQVVARADAADAGYQALWDAACSRTLVDMLILDGPLTEEGACGFRAAWNVNPSGGPTQGADELQYTTFDLKPGWKSGRLPKVVDVGAASALTETAI